MFSAYGHCQAACRLVFLVGVIMLMGQPACSEKYSAAGQKQAATVADLSRESIELFLKCSDYHELAKMPLKWKADLSPEARSEILSSLVEGLSRNTMIGLDHLDDTTISSRLKSGKMTHPGHGVILRQDVFIESGRCAWGIERLLDCSLPEFNEASNADTVVEARKIIIKNLANRAFRVRGEGTQ